MNLARQIGIAAVVLAAGAWLPAGAAHTVPFFDGFEGYSNRLFTVCRKII